LKIKNQVEDRITRPAVTDDRHADNRAVGRHANIQRKPSDYDPTASASILLPVSTGTSSKKNLNHP